MGGSAARGDGLPAGWSNTPADRSSTHVTLDAPVTHAVLARELRDHAVARGCLADAQWVIVGRGELRSPRPFDGRLAGVLRDMSGTPLALLGLVVPVVWAGAGSAPALLVVADHVNLTLRGPLTGRWPAGVPRSFPCMTGIYQPATVRPQDEPRVYSSAIVAGVSNRHRLSSFERTAIVAGPFSAFTDSLVAPMILAAYHRVPVVAVGIPQASAALHTEGLP